jgi:hypothetical protein
VDTTTLVDRDLEEGQRALDRLAGEGIPVRAACLLKLQDRIKPSLYIATPLVDLKGPIQAYRDVLAPLTSLDGMLDALDVSLVGEKHPLVQEVRSRNRRRGGGFVSPDFNTFGGMAVDEVYVYPPSKSFPGFYEIKQRFPSVEEFTIELPGQLAHTEQGRWLVIESLLGKVNSSEFQGKPPETLLFHGGGADPEKGISRLVFAYRPESWNTIYDSNAKQWRRVVMSETNRPPYEPADFTPLITTKTPPVVAGT